MIKINNIEYNKFETDISWGKFTLYSNGQKRTGIAPFITFYVDDMLIGLELTFTKDMFEDAQIGVETDIKKYISDITFEDEKGWISINDGQCHCNITRISKDRFHIDFHIIGHDLDDKFNILIDDEIDIL